MFFGIRPTCAWTDKGIKRLLLTVYFYYTITSVEVTGRKLLPINTNARGDSPFYETRNNFNNFQLVNDHPSEQYFTLHDNEQHLDPNPTITKVQNYYIPKDKPDGTLPKGKLYRIEQFKRMPPTGQINSRASSGHQHSIPRQTRTYEPPAHSPPEEDAPADQEGKKYAFAYAVRPKDGYTKVGGDFNISHKESRDGKVTMGEYKVLLPDGRLQIVRYTADGKSGFKADVTYEADEVHAHSNEQPVERHTTAIGKPTSEIHNQYVPPPPLQTPSPPSPSHKSPALISKGIRTHPSLSPALYYQSSGTDDHHYSQPNHYIQHSINISPSPPPKVYYKSNPRPYAPFKNPSPTPGYVTLKRAIGAKVSSLLNKVDLPTPKNLYEKIHGHVPVVRGQRAGPATSHYVESSPSPPSLYEGSQRNVGHHLEAHFTSNPTPAPEHPPFQYSRPLVLEHPSDSPGTPKPRIRKHRILSPVAYPTPPPRQNKNGLVPFTVKAGPELSGNGNEYGPFEHTGGSSEYHAHAHSHELNEPHYILQEVEHEESLPVYNQRLHIESAPTRQIPPVKSSLATFTSNLVHAGISTPSPPLYLKTKRVIPVGRAVKPSVGGLVYLETPATGPRPTALGVKEVLANLRHDNLPRPKTTTHPYELGSKDYGNNVGYSPATEENYRTIGTNFKPSQEIPQEYLPHHQPHPYHREYLLERNESGKELSHDDVESNYE